jgi:hypothetical protein
MCFSYIYLICKKILEISGHCYIVMCCDLFAIICPKCVSPSKGASIVMKIWTMSDWYKWKQMGWNNRQWSEFMCTKHRNNVGPQQCVTILTYTLVTEKSVTGVTKNESRIVTWMLRYTSCNIHQKAFSDTEECHANWKIVDFYSFKWNITPKYVKN